MSDPSYSKINYSLRPAKNVERKMIMEALSRLSAFGKLSAYHYVGFGSPFFGDFLLAHKNLGIRWLTSIEVEDADKERFDFNRPFENVELVFGHSNEVLPALSWDTRRIVWLDYDGRLDASVLADIQTFISRAVAGSALVITVNADLGETSLATPHRLENLQAAVGKSKVPDDIREKDLVKWGTAKVMRRIMRNTIEETLVDRNGTLRTENEFRFHQLFNFHYADGAPMLTYGGTLHDVAQTGFLSMAGFDDLPFISTGEDPYRIEIPALTIREMRYFDSQLPRDDIAVIDRKGVPERDVKRYSKLYRHFPGFVDAEIH